MLQRAVSHVAKNEGLPELASDCLAAAKALLPFGGSSQVASKHKRSKKRARKSSAAAVAGPLTALVGSVVADVESAIQSVRSSRQPLRLQARAMRPKAIRAYDPLFEDGNGGGVEAAKAEVRRLKRQIKRERKGVARELRKDAEFIAEVAHAQHNTTCPPLPLHH